MPVRIIPVLQIDNGKLVKTHKFEKPRYVGDPINAIKIFNEKEVDEIIILDISARANKKLNYKLLDQMASEAFMPITYGGGITRLEEMKTIINLGIERISINTSGLEDFEFYRKAIDTFGTSTIVASIDFKREKNKYEIKTNGGKTRLKHSVEHVINQINTIEPGELLITSIDNDGTFTGYPKSKIQNPKSKIQNPKSKIQNPKSKIQN
ncbi:MAG: HisA/HisF-related TIM barrel protein, partial [Bacteroidales bacterium]